jgi:hypothetical protein
MSHRFIITVKDEIDAYDVQEALYEYGGEGVEPLKETWEFANGYHRMTTKQRDKLWELCGGSNVPFNEENYKSTFDLPHGYVAGWVGKVYYGVDPEGRASS